MAGFLRALPVVLGHEGGYSDHPADRGGVTLWGVTQGTYDLWRKSQDLEPRPVSELTADEAQSLYHTGFWLEAKCDAWPWPLSLVVFDAAVNHGPQQAIRLLQRSVGVPDDGLAGPVTFGAVKPGRAREHSDDLLWERASFYAEIVIGDPTQRVFLRGWLNRLRRLRGTVWGDR